MTKRKVIIDWIEADLAVLFYRFVEEARSSRAISHEMIKQLSREELGSMIEYIKDELAHQIGKYIIENGLLIEVEYNDVQHCQDIMESTLFVIKPENIKKFLRSMAAYIVDRWLNEPKSKN